MNVQGAALFSKYLINQPVTTPLGVGLYQSPYAVLTAQGEVVVTGALVKLPVNEVTSPALKNSNCLTPTAKLNGLWVFQERELQ